MLSDLLVKENDQTDAFNPRDKHRGTAAPQCGTVMGANRNDSANCCCRFWIGVGVGIGVGIE
ncbi:hypothetical protein JCM31598_06520 [Desulfonatronum parangueonense]